MKAAAIVVLAVMAAFKLFAGVGDPQLSTDHPFYPGEFACSTFERLFASQAEQYRRTTGIEVTNEHHKALASWFWRNTHYFHGEEGAEKVWNESRDGRNREYWTGLFAHGFGLCGTTHSQWTAEMEHLLGHCRARGAGVRGHNSFEVFLKGGPYGQGRWALLDHDLSTVIFDSAGDRLLSLSEVCSDHKNLTRRDFFPAKQNGWLVCGLHPNDGSVFSDYDTAEYLAGYAAAPPIVHLRCGETLRRYFQPGLEDGRTFVFWGRNYNAGGVAGPERSLTWVNSPEKMYRSKDGAEHRTGQARYGNAVYSYKPNFVTHDYREGVVSESREQIVFEFYTPYIIAATPPDSSEWGIYKTGCRNGLVIRGNGNCRVALSVDGGRSWSEPAELRDELDLTDHAKGHRQVSFAIDDGKGVMPRSLGQIESVHSNRLPGKSRDFPATERWWNNNNLFCLGTRDRSFRAI